MTGSFDAKASFLRVCGSSWTIPLSELMMSSWKPGMRREAHFAKTSSLVGTKYLERKYWKWRAREIQTGVLLWPDDFVVSADDRKLGANRVTDVAPGFVFVMSFERRADKSGVSTKRVRNIEDRTSLERLDDANPPSTSASDQVDNVGLVLTHSPLEWRP